MRAIKYYLIFVAICLFFTVYFLISNEYFYSCSYYNTYYHINYFYFTLLSLLIGSLVYFISYRKFNKNKN